MISKKAQEIPPFIVMDVLEKAQELERKGEHIIHLEVGEPDFDTPECVNEAGYRAICEGKTHYTHSLGLYELREAIAEDYWKKYHVKVSLRANCCRLWNFSSNASYLCCTVRTG